MPSIFVNFVKNNKFGCDQYCPFCEWSKQNFNIYYCPSKEDLLKFHNELGPKLTWQISGGGDPLYNFEENWPKLKEVLDTAHELGHRVVLLTRKIDAANKYFDVLKDYIDTWYFSVSPAISNELKEFSNKVEIDKIHVSLVLNSTSNEKINWEKVIEIINQYEPYVSQITFRNNFIHPLKINSLEELKNKFKNISEKANFNQSNGKTAVLFMGEILTCRQIDIKYLKI